MPLIRCTNVFYKGDHPVTLLPPPRRLAPSLGLGTTWVRQLRSGSCHHPTAATKCNVQPSRATETPSVEKHAHPPRVVYCAIYLTLTLITKFRVSNYVPPTEGGGHIVFGAVPVGVGVGVRVGVRVRVASFLRDIF